MNIDVHPAAAALRTAALAAREATGVLARSSGVQRNLALTAAATALRDRAALILAANARDVARFTGSAAMRDRLTLTTDRIEAMARGMEEGRGAARSARACARRLDPAERG